ncbi:MAG TPA: DNA mismatch repair endonuclease MutL [Polyangiaceae bacterium]|nr:DNA mismatch repair endonuclease MutL [Polyangiaceae bacterium]
MPRIVVLPTELANQIAAGEVVERPASVVKELIENSLDAGATRIDVEIDGGGITRIVVSDDGHGMAEDDARLCIERHATSKLSRFEDLNRLHSFGFRGEALPSIASVSRFTLRTRPRDDDAGVELVYTGGGAPSVRPTGMAPGTRVEIADLFHNVPARRKFLKSSGTEGGHVTDVIEAAALSRPEVTFSLSRDGRRVREFLRTEAREERVRQVSDGAMLTAFSGERGPMRVDAFLSRPEDARTGASGLWILVNHRPVRDRALSVTIAQAYGSVLERGRYPRGVVYLDLPLPLVDVNVHPQKSEVRFADPRTVSDALYSILSKGLTTAFSLPPTNRGAWGRPAAATAQAAAPAPAQAPSSPPPATGLSTVGVSSDPTVSTESTTATMAVQELAAVDDTRSLIAVRDSATAPIQPASEMLWSSLRFIAQLRQTYLLCEGKEGIYLLDQHAAAERVNFTKLRHQYQSRAVASQALLFPITVEVTPAESELVEQHAEKIREVGLDVRVRGPETLSVHGVPKLLQRASAERLLRDLLSELSRQGGRGFSAAVDLSLATMACHGSVRAGDPLSATEAQALLVALDSADFAGHCPHGRPVVTFTSWAELERKVGRR